MASGRAGGKAEQAPVPFAPVAHPTSSVVRAAKWIVFLLAVTARQRKLCAETLLTKATYMDVE